MYFLIGAILFSKIKLFKNSIQRNEIVQYFMNSRSKGKIDWVSTVGEFVEYGVCIVFHQIRERIVYHVFELEQFIEGV